jgi:RNA polymerase sigma-54 factor
MGLELKQNLRLSQQLVMTPQLQQAIKLLQMNRMELAEMINHELVENPILEEMGDPDGPGGDDENLPQDPEGEQKRDEEAYEKIQNEEDKLVAGKDDFNWESYVEDFNSSSSSAPSMREVNEDLPSFESVLTKTTTLEDHLLWQLSMSALADGERQLGELILGNMNQDGYLEADFDELVKETEMDPEDAGEVLKMIQHFDPIGSASRNLQECLMIQASFLDPKQPLVEQIIAEHMGDLEKKNYQVIAKAVQKTLPEVIEATKIILEFEPKPGRAFQASDAQYITPDIYVYKVGEEYAIVLNEDGMPKLRISSYYRDILSGNKTTTPTIESKNTKEYVQDKLRSAMWLIRSIHNRQKTIYKVTEAIVQRQRDFFEKGVDTLKPMVLKDVANDIGMHESTISRVTTNKYVHTPVGIFELKYFFNSSVNTADGSESVASESVKQKIKQLVGNEDPKKPLSDQKIVELLKSSNINIARRTVAKYRDMLNILSSSKRKKYF